MPRSRYACLIALTFCATAASAANDATRVFVENGELHYSGYLDDDANQRLFALYESLAIKPTVLAIESKGGIVDFGLDLGDWVYRKGLDVKVSSYCLSSCANYVFTAAPRKTVSNVAVIGFHGGISSTKFDLGGERQAAYDAMTSEQRDAFWAGHRKEIQPLLQRETDFFKKIGVRQDITTYGQASRFDLPDMDGWTFTREDFARFGVDRIEVIDGPWRPAMPGNAITITTIEVD
ncbi:hypothetical protein [Massilia oculi]|uniref:hypothetical protein n=1 Tax=Massilia oculi TaxID=945844 RepID=UPI0028AEC69C|nr:hypothetical protein [Massilia oculi]